MLRATWLGLFGGVHVQVDRHARRERARGELLKITLRLGFD